MSESYFDLGLRPGADQSPAASVSVSRALSSRDEMTAEAAFARLSGAGSTIDQDSEVIDQATAKVHVTARVTRELSALVELQCLEKPRSERFENVLAADLFTGSASSAPRFVCLETMYE